MKTSEDIDIEIQALYKAAEKKKTAASSEKSNKEIKECMDEIRKLEEAWEFEKTDQQHLFEETRKKYEADVYMLVERINSVE